MGDRFSVDPPVEPMLAKPIAGLPASAEGLAFEPKWDGFRIIAYRRGDEVVLQGRMRGTCPTRSRRWWRGCGRCAPPTWCSTASWS
ncbi:MAG: hypothetical protein MUF66_15695 [Gammaproteobacteria bacterium]|nr:hypothetical protein [Gammaproteobacteria bacterium]